MTFKVGPSGNPNGRPKGSKNKQTLAVTELLEALGCDPIEGMAMIAMDEKADPTLRAQIYKELAQYIAPKRKAVEMKTEGQLSLVDLIQSIGQREDPASATDR
jgi:Family of unknown function (DUF5681)